jgi:hypothetical protein
MQYTGNYFHCENNIATLAYPSVTISFDVKDEIETSLTPATRSNQPYVFDEMTALSNSTMTNVNTVSFNLIACNIKTILPDKTSHQ